MKKILVCLFTCLFLASCVAGELTPQRSRLHNMEKEKICEKNPHRCIDGTNIDW